VCGGTGGGPIPCTTCGGTGRVSRPGPPWLSCWRNDHALAEFPSALITAGLGAHDEQAMVYAALDADGCGPVCYVCEDPDITRLGDRSLAHYDVTGRCQGQHPHVAWDAASANIDEITLPAQQLAYAAVDPAATWKPPANIEPGNFAGYINPGMWRTLPVVAVALWAAGASGQGTRAAMEWLAAGQLAHMVAFCRPLEQRLGRGSLPLLSISAELLAGPEAERQAAVQLAWQSLAPVEEAIRLGTGAQRLDLRSWLAARGMLAVSLPPEASVAYRQMVVAMLVAARAVAGPDASLLEPTVIWRHAPAPHAAGDAGNITQQRWLVLTEGAAGFASWTARAATSGMRQPAWLLGDMTDPGVLAAASRRLGVMNVPAPSAGQALLIQDAGPPVILTRDG
jgi:hypothetical protein